MTTIKTLYVVNHSHTDIGFTDYQDLCFRQHAEFIDAAMDLIEATADYPAEAHYTWICEITGMTEKYLRQASPEQRERFARLNREGSIGVAGMQYNLTPLLTPEQMIRSLYPVRRLRDEYGIEISAAMQCDVNGISWMYADLLPAMGIDFLTMSVNPFRGGVPKPWPCGLWWESPTGQKLLAWNGYHYLFGRSIAKQEVDKIEAREDWPFDFMYCQSTHPVRVDNGPPDPRMADFVRDWNAKGNTPRIEFTTPAAFGKVLRERYADQLPTWRGDWLDWWSDGVASSAYETGVSRATHELIPTAEALGAWSAATGTCPWDTARADHLLEQTTLYDEHTWGAFASIERPQDRWVKAQWNRKANFAYTASSEAHDLVARGTGALAHKVATFGPDGMFNLGDLDPNEAYPTPTNSDVLVINALPWQRTVLVDEPEIRGQAAPAGVLDCFFARDVSWGGLRPESPKRKISGEVPGYGFAFLPVANASSDGLVAEPNVIANEHYRVRIDPATGALAEWVDLATGHNYAGSYNGYGIGQYVYETVDSPDQRNALYVGDFSAPDFGYRKFDTPFVRETVTSVTVEEPVVFDGEVAITVHVEAPGVKGARCTYRLRRGERVLDVDWLLDKEHHPDVEAVLIAFPFALDGATFRADINGLPITPEDDQIHGTVRDWYPVGRWVDVSDDQRGATLAPLEAPLVHLGGITTGRWQETLEPEGPTIMSWALNNHWMVNFKASQGGEIPLRYRLTTHDGPCDDLAATRFAREVATPAIVIRDVEPSGERAGQFLTVEDGPVDLIHLKPADFGEGIIARFQNITEAESTATVRFPAIAPGAATLTSPAEEDGEALPLADGALTVTVPARSIQSVRLTF
jgi:hypothetical protein